MYNVYSIIDGAVDQEESFDNYDDAVDQEESFDNYDDAIDYASKLEREYREDAERDYETTIHANDTVYQNLLVDVTIERA